MTLDCDGARGNTGETAQLSLRHEYGPTLDQQKSAVPVELMVTLPKTWGYLIDASEVADPGNPFRGHYHLTVTSVSGGRELCCLRHHQCSDHHDRGDDS